MLPRLKRLTIAGTAIAALALGGSALAGAATSTTSASSTTTPTSNHRGAMPRPSGAPSGPGFTAANAPGAPVHENAEKTVTGADAARAQAAAVASVGGTGGAVTTNFTHDGYEVTVAKSNGSTVTVRLDSAFKVQQAGGGPR